MKDGLYSDISLKRKKYIKVKTKLKGYQLLKLDIWSLVSHSQLQFCICAGHSSTSSDLFHVFFTIHGMSTAFVKHFKFNEIKEAADIMQPL